MKRKSTHAFTLIELLIVISMIAILTLISIPAFQDIGRGSKMQSAISQLSTTINLARQWAITHKEDVYLVFPDDYDQLYSGLSAEHKGKALRSYAAYVVGKGYITDWRYLPPGIYFVDTYNGKNDKNMSDLMDKYVVTGSNIFRQQTIFNTLAFPDSNASVGRFINAIKFVPDGKAEANSFDFAPFELYMSEGVALEGSGGKVINLVWKENPSLRGISINKWTGGTRVIDFSQVE